MQCLASATEYTAKARINGRTSFRMSRPTALSDRALLLLQLDTGLRVGEVSRLRTGDVDLIPRPHVDAQAPWTGGGCDAMHVTQCARSGSPQGMSGPVVVNTYAHFMSRPLR